MRIASLALLCLALMLPASAQVLYDDGPINGTTDAWTINFGEIVGDTFQLSANSTVGGFNFGAWEFAGDILTSVDWSITSEFDGGTLYGSGTASGKNLTDQFISTNQYGYDIDQITVTGLKVNLASGTTYWLNLQNAVVPSGDPVYWDENDGKDCKGDNGMGGGCPSEAFWTGCILAGANCPPESFDINGTSGGSTPEPSSIMLFGSGILGLGGALRRKLF
jgi:PEP-CTERM motif-containing protein